MTSKIHLLTSLPNQAETFGLVTAEAPKIQISIKNFQNLMMLIGILVSMKWENMMSKLILIVFWKKLAINRLFI